MRAEQLASEVFHHLWGLAARSGDQFIAVEDYPNPLYIYVHLSYDDEIVGPKMFVARNVDDGNCNEEDDD